MLYTLVYRPRHAVEASVTFCPCHAQGLLVVSRHYAHAAGTLAHQRHVAYEAADVSRHELEAQQVVQSHLVAPVVAEEQPEHLIHLAVAVEEVLRHSAAAELAVGGVRSHFSVVFYHVEALLRPVGVGERLAQLLQVAFRKGVMAVYDGHFGKPLRQASALAVVGYGLLGLKGEAARRVDHAELEANVARHHR